MLDYLCRCFFISETHIFRVVTLIIQNVNNFQQIEFEEKKQRSEELGCSTASRNNFQIHKKRTLIETLLKLRWTHVL